MLFRKGSAHGTVVLAAPLGKGNQDTDLAPALLRGAESFSASLLCWMGKTFVLPVLELCSC